MRSKHPLVLTAAILFLTLLACLGGLGISMAAADRPLPAPDMGLDEMSPAAVTRSSWWPTARSR